MKNKILLLLGCLMHLAASGQTFTDVTQQSGINVSSALGDVVVWIDHNNDGWLDLFYASNIQTLFYENNGVGAFIDKTAFSGLGLTVPHSVAVGDFDNDGFADLLIASIHSGTPLQIFRNNFGNGFTEFYSAPFPCQRAIWIDYNGDGLLDIFCNTWSSAQARLLKNNGDGTFTEVTEAMNFNQQSGITAAASDYNNDGLLDIYCTSSSTNATNRLYSNVAASTFSDETFSAFVMDFRRGVAQAWGDFNNNGWMDLYVGNINSNRNVFFKNNGDGTFSEAAVATGIQDVGDARTCVWLDVNNDGLLDLFTTNHVNPNKLYKNNGNETFTNIAQVAGVAGPQDGFAVSWGDYDRDGDLDVLIAGHSYGMVLLRNNGGVPLNFLNVTLNGDYDNSSGIGARVSIYHNTNIQIREVNGGRGAVSQDALSLHFGLGNATMVDSIIIRWPSGMAQKLYEVSSNQFLNIQQQGNVPPTIFHLIEPIPDSTYMTNQLEFRWTASSDPDSSDPVEYFLYLSNNINDTIIGPMQDTTLLLQTVAWMQTDTIHWYVHASDGIDQRTSWEQWEFNNINLMIPGDANCDGIVNVLDVITIVNYITGQNPVSFCFYNADVNGDVMINILDIIETINLIIG